MSVNTVAMVGRIMACTDGFSVWVESAERRSYADVRRFADGVTALRREPEENIAAAAACAAAFAAGLVTAAVDDPCLEWGGREAARREAERVGRAAFDIEIGEGRRYFIARRKGAGLSL